MIASVSFKDFKALRSTSLKLAAFNLIIGANGSGKTSLIQSLIRLRTLALLPLAPVHPGGGRRAGGPKITFHFAAPHEKVEARLECVSELVCDLLQVVPDNAPDWPTLRAKIARIRSYAFEVEAIVQPSTAVAAGSDLALVSNGANLGAFLAALQKTAPTAYAAMTAEVIRIFPEFSALELMPGASGSITFGLTLADGEGTVIADSLSQGSLYLIAILALAFDPHPPSVLCIEEIDRGIHPRMLREVRDALYRLSYPRSFRLAREPVQVIATTHSPYLVDLFREHPEEVVIAQKHGQASHFERLSDRADVAELLKEGSLGDIWFSGILGGVPDEA